MECTTVGQAIDWMMAHQGLPLAEPQGYLWRYSGGTEFESWDAETEAWQPIKNVLVMALPCSPADPV